MVGFPGWKIAVRFDIPLQVRVPVKRDRLSKGQTATSQGLNGLVAKASTRRELMAEVLSSAEMLLSEQLKRTLKRQPAVAWIGELMAA